jgi:hypothetical protein
MADSWTPQLPPAGVSQIGEGPRTAEADLPSYPAHDSDAGAEEGNSEGRSGTSPAFPCGHNDRRVYAGDSRRTSKQASTRLTLNSE